MDVCVSNTHTLTRTHIPILIHTHIIIQQGILPRTSNQQVLCCAVLCWAAWAVLNFIGNSEIRGRETFTPDDDDEQLDAPVWKVQRRPLSLSLPLFLSLLSASRLLQVDNDGLDLQQHIIILVWSSILSPPTVRSPWRCKCGEPGETGSPRRDAEGESSLLSTISTRLHA